MLLPAAIFTPRRMEVAAPVAHRKHCNQPEKKSLVRQSSKAFTNMIEKTVDLKYLFT
jgi:hypothetical protein